MRLGEPRIEVASCESTQSLLDASLPEGAIAIADVQTAGRGRLGRTWEAPPGTSILCSILLKPPPDRKLPQLALVAGVAVADAIEELTRLAPQIKWPNDVLLGGRKVAGILAEARGGAVVLGMGLNVNQTAAELPSGAASLLSATRRRWDRTVVLDALLSALEARYRAWAGEGLDGVFDGLAARDFLRGRRVGVDGASGKALGIDREGRLEIELAHGELRAIESGEVLLA